jgi:hypothetical protein
MVMNRFSPSLLIACILVAGCDPDTSPTGGGPSGDAAAGSAGTAGAAGTGGGMAGSGGDLDSGPDAESDAGQEGGEEGGDAQGEGGAGYSHTILIDGNNDFTAASEQFNTSSMGTDVYHGYVSWDATFLYVGMDGPAIFKHDGQDWIVVYIGGTPGGKTGIGYGAQAAPGLPMDCKYHVRWKADGTYTDAQKWNGTGWSPVPVNWSVQQASSGTYAELAISRLDFDFPAKVQVLFSMVREKQNAEWTWAGVPAAGLADNINASYTKYFEFDFASTAAPNTATPLP